MRDGDARDSGVRDSDKRNSRERDSGSGQRSEQAGKLREQSPRELGQAVVCIVVVQTAVWMAVARAVVNADGGVWREGTGHRRMERRGQDEGGSVDVLVGG